MRVPSGSPHALSVAKLKQSSAAWMAARKGRGKGGVSVTFEVKPTSTRWYIYMIETANCLHNGDWTNDDQSNASKQRSESFRS